MQVMDLSNQEKDTIFWLMEKLIGIPVTQANRHEVVLSNVIRRVHATSSKSLNHYLSFVTKNEEELGFLISAMTIHTTSWFREMPHYKNLEQFLTRRRFSLPGTKFRLLSAAASTGEEIYSFGMILESFRRQISGFEYELIGTDIDEVSLERARSAVYKIDDISVVPEAYRRFLVQRARYGKNHFSPDMEIQKRSQFKVGNLLDISNLNLGKFDQIVCRNVLIYFQTKEVSHVISQLLKFLDGTGVLTLGHCEMIDGKAFDLVCTGNATYQRTSAVKASAPKTEEHIHVLIVDDSAAVRTWLAKVLEDQGIKVSNAESAEAATEFLKRQRVDLIILDLNLPGQHGLDWLVETRRKGEKAPVVLFTEVNAAEAPNVLEALSETAQDYMNKATIGANGNEIIERVRALVKNRSNSSSAPAEKAKVPIVKKMRPRPKEFKPSVILVGASTGGTEAVAQLLHQMPKDCPPVVVVQHIPPEFATAFLTKLAQVSGLTVGTARNGLDLLPGHVYMSTDDLHIGLKAFGGKLSVFQSSSEKLFGQRPSVDFLFRSAALVKEQKILACLLTGMGKDGAKGLVELADAGALALAQDESSSIVWGMPGEAVRLGAAHICQDPRRLREVICSITRDGRLPIWAVMD
jgi:two-component system chemotaxis response regulator CheB